jgi:phosphoribosylaminoimidazole (AIR) synthetase
MGIGMVLVVSRDKTGEIILRLKRFKINSWVIGEIVKGKREVVIA